MCVLAQLVARACVYSTCTCSSVMACVGVSSTCTFDNVITPCSLLIMVVTLASEFMG